MSELYLIAHKVRGEPAFDIAKQMECPLCTVEADPMYDFMVNPPGPHRIGNCAECDSLGYWWIIPTSGHRAYPYWSQEVSGLQCHHYDSVEPVLDDMPPSLPDHYRHGPAPKVDIKALFKKSDWVPNPEAFIKRRL